MYYTFLDRKKVFSFQGVSQDGPGKSDIYENLEILKFWNCDVSLTVNSTEKLNRPFDKRFHGLYICTKQHFSKIL